ncbi:hypothetical protein MK280_12710, partial [Myxococcota bacterium]|nr:hypothetical protein [Myxococcota bacterium]
RETGEWYRAQANLQYFRSDANRLGARFALVVFPVLFELGKDYPLEAAVDEILRFANAEQMETLSLLPAFRGRAASELWVSPLDQHPNAKAHEIAAGAIFEMLRESEQPRAEVGDRSVSTGGERKPARSWVGLMPRIGLDVQVTGVYIGPT